VNVTDTSRAGYRGL